MVDEGGPVSGDALGWGVEGFEEKVGGRFVTGGLGRPSELAGDPRNWQAVYGDFSSPAPVGNGRRLGDFGLCAGQPALKASEHQVETALGRGLGATLDRTPGTPNT